MAVKVLNDKASAISWPRPYNAIITYTARTCDVIDVHFGQLFHLLSHDLGCLTITLYVTRHENVRMYDGVSIRKVRGLRSRSKEPSSFFRGNGP